MCIEWGTNILASRPRKFFDYIDFFIMPNLCCYYTNVAFINDVVLTLSNTLIHKFIMPELTSKNTGWEAFAENVASKINRHTRLKTEKELEEASNSLIEIVTLAIKQEPRLSQ